MSEKALFKSKYRMGQKVWFIANGYIATEVIKGIFVDKWGSIMYSFVNFSFGMEKHELDDTHTYPEHSLFPSKEALIKDIKETDHE